VTLTVGLLGGIPPSLGGGGLELQVARTAAALERRGHRVVHVDREAEPRPFDVLHAFGSEPDIWHRLTHWTRNRVPLVVTPIVVVSPGLKEVGLRASARLPGIVSSGRMRRELLEQASTVIAGTEYERGLLTGSFGADPATTLVIGNGADRVTPGTLPPGVPEGPFALSLGSITPRKRVAETARVLAGGTPLVVAGRYAGPAEELAGWERTVEETGAVWLGEVGDPGEVAALQHGAEALVHLSAAEVQSLAVIETLAQGSPVVLSDIPGHRELAERYPAHVRVVSGPPAVLGALESLRDSPAADPPEVPTWDDVAIELERVYESV